MKNIILYNIENTEIKCLSKKYEIYDENKHQNEEDFIILVCIFFGIDKRNEIFYAQYDNIKLKNIADSLINENIMKILKKNNSKLLLFDSWEIMNLDDCSNLQYFITNILQLDLNKIILSYNDIYNNYKAIYNIIPYDWTYLINKINFDEKYITIFDNVKNKYIISLNRRSNVERLFSSFYLYTKYKDKCYLSYIELNICIYEDIVLYAKQNDIDISDLSLSKYNNFINSLPLTLDCDDFYKVVWSNTDNVKSYIDDSYIMLVYETNVYNDNRLQISEKTYKPIYSGMPFILFACSPGILKHLQKLGFKTFHPLINESYDDNYNYQKRYNLLINEITRIMNLTQNEIHELYLQCLPIVKHNLEILKSFDNIPELLIDE